MALTVEQLQEAGAILTVAETVRAAAAQLRQRFPGIQASVVDPFDMKGETPAVKTGDRAIYLMSSDGHCWSITQDPARASAFVLTGA
ncbi:hypothetical protein [Derxia gummosa]|uniref:Uncharacterized protein n=1 Tax=Derxia gummosa DSM 723 TaxID=1121388 RepID=A0A8B6X1W8_9BURK|nr:hypothetical protein [Derxia gummosa]